MDVGCPMVIMENSFIHWIVLYCRLGFSKHFDSYRIDNESWINLSHVSAARPLFTSMSESSVVSPMQDRRSQGGRLSQTKLLYQLWRQRSRKVQMSEPIQVSSMQERWSQCRKLSHAKVLFQLWERRSLIIGLFSSSKMPPVRIQWPSN